MNSKRLGKGVFIILIFILLVFFFGYYIIRFYPFGDKIQYKPKHFSGEIVENCVMQYDNSNRSFIGIEVEDKLFPFSTFVSKNEHMDYYGYFGDVENIEFEHENNKVHLARITRKTSLFMKSYTVIISMYYDGYYLHNHISDSEYKDINFKNNDEVIKESKKKVDDLIKVYFKNKPKIENVFRKQLG